MIHSRGANASDAEVVWTQILQGMGGGVAAVASQVAAQASVPHIDMATATAIVLLITEIGGAMGSAIGNPSFVLVYSYAVDSWCYLDQHSASQVGAVSAEPVPGRPRRPLCFGGQGCRVSSW